MLEGLDLTPSRGLSVSVLTGAGISADSGVPIFRGKGSMWENEKAHELSRKAGPPWNTKGTWEFYKWRRELVRECEPNAAHLTLAEMEDYFDDFYVITQNVDGLHQRAGSIRVHELHGNMWKGRCPEDGEVVDLLHPLEKLPPRHGCGTALRPHVVQFGEPIPEDALEPSLEASRRADLFIVVGTSAVVSPARDLPLIALDRGSIVVEINRDPTPLSDHVDLSARGRAAELVPRFWREFRGAAKG